MTSFAVAKGNNSGFIQREIVLVSQNVVFRRKVSKLPSTTSTRKDKSAQNGRCICLNENYVIFLHNREPASTGHLERL